VAVSGDAKGSLTSEVGDVTGVAVEGRPFVDDLEADELEVRRDRVVRNDDRRFGGGLLASIGSVGREVFG